MQTLGLPDYLVQVYYILKTGIGKQLPFLEDWYLKNGALEKLFYLDSTTCN